MEVFMSPVSVVIPNALSLRPQKVNLYTTIFIAHRL
jgi:hypothetical protein